MWTLKEAIEQIQTLEAKLAPAGFHVGLLGGVLLNGESTHDLDLVIFQHKVPCGGPIHWWEPAIEVLEEHFDQGLRNVPWAKKSEREDFKEVRWVRPAHGNRIDFFFMR